jgi:hypothetical protein
MVTPQWRKDFLRQREGQTAHYGLRKVLGCTVGKALLEFCTRRRSFGYCQNFPRLKKNEKGEPSDLTFWGGQKVEHFFSPFLDPLPVYEFL